VVVRRDTRGNPMRCRDVVMNKAGIFDPRACAGETVRIAVAEGDDDEKGLRDKASTIRETMGIQIDVTVLPLAILVKETPAYLAPSLGPYDIITVLGFTVPSGVGTGGFERLNNWVNDPSRTPADYDFADFPAAELEYCGYYDIAQKRYGGHDLYLIPGIHSGSCIYYYRADLMEAAGLDPPQTWEQCLDAARTLHSGDVAGHTMVGADELSLFTVDWYTRFITAGGVLMSGNLLDRNFEPNMTSDPAIASLQMLIDLLPYSPPDVTRYGWRQSVASMAEGRSAQMVMWSTSAGVLFDPKRSAVADRIGVGMVPAVQGNRPRAVRGGFGLGIPRNAARKDAAWHVMTYITSKAFNIYQTRTYRSDPNRSSAFSDPGLVAELPYLPVAMRAWRAAQIMEAAPAPQFYFMKDIANREFHAALTGNQSARKACARVQDQWAEILRDAGWLR